MPDIEELLKEARAKGASREQMEQLLAVYEEPVKKKVPSELSSTGLNTGLPSLKNGYDFSQDSKEPLIQTQGTPTPSQSDFLSQFPVMPSRDQGTIKGDKTFMESVNLGANLLQSALKKGVLGLAEGGAYIAEKTNPLNAAMAPVVNAGLARAHENAPSGLNPQFAGRNVVERTIAGLVEMAPAIATAETGGFLLSGMGNFHKEVEQMKRNGVEFPNGSDDAYILLGGLANELMLKKLPASVIINKLPAPLRKAVIDKVSAEAFNKIANSGGKLTAETLLKPLTEEARSVSDKIMQGGVNFLKNYAKTEGIFAGLTLSNAAAKKVSDKIAGADNFDPSMEDVKQGLENTLGESLAFTIAGAGIQGLTDPGALIRKTPIHTAVLKALREDPSDAGVNRIGADLETHLIKQGVPSQEITNSLKALQNIHEAVKTIPKSFGEAKFNKAVDLITGRKELENQLAEIKASKTSVDESIRDIPTKEEKLVEAKLEQSGDKLRELASDHKYRYKFDQEKGTYTKQLGGPETSGGKAEEITKDRYDLEQLEKEFKKPKEEPTDAIRERSPEKISVEESSGNSGEMGEGIPEPRPEVVTETRTSEAVPESKKEEGITPFKLGGNDKFYHASHRKRVGRLESKTAPQFGKGVYLSTNKDLVIDEFGKELTEVQLNIKKPLYTDSKEWTEVRKLALKKADAAYGKEKELTLGEDETYFRYDPEDLSEIAEIPSEFISDAAKELGYDAIVDKDSHTYDNEIVVLDESKIDYAEDKVDTEKPNPAITKAEFDLTALKQSEDKATKYEKSLARLTEAKKNKAITEKEFNDFQKRFDDVMKDSEQAVKKDKIVAEEPTENDITAKQLREYLNETQSQESVKTPSSKATGSRTRKEGDYLYNQDRPYFDNILSEVNSGKDPELREKILNKLKPEETTTKPPDSGELKVGDSVSFINQLKEPDTGRIVDVKDNGDYVVLKSNGVKNNMSPDKLTKVEQQKVEAGSAVGVLPYTKEFIEHDIAPLAKKLGEGIHDTVRRIMNVLSPKTGVSDKALTTLMKGLGERNEASALVDKTLSAFEDTFDKMKDPDRIAFIDKIKRGEKQPTPELQQVADALASLDKDLFDEIQKYKPGLNWKENHYRVLWKEIPGTKKTRFWSSLRKRPLQGSKGFLKKATLIDMSEGIDKGGVPYSTNPVKMFKLAYTDAMKFITANRMFDALKKDGLVKFVAPGKEPPEGFAALDDRIAKIYFKVPEGLVQGGEYYVEENAARLLNNHLSRDRIRETKAGQGLMEMKNIYTQAELSLSAFHAVAEGLEGVSSQIGMGLRKLVNLGTKGDFKSIAEGVKDIATAPLAPGTTYKLGRKGIKLTLESDFENSKLGQAFLKRMPDAKEYIHDFFMGGGLLKQHDDLRIKTIDALKEHANKDNYIGAALRAIPAMNEMIMNPLFNHYIPALKTGMFLKEYPLVLRENKSRLESGKVTREQLARKTVDFIDDRIGEMNFDNLFWNRTFKTAMQFMLRSVTWKLGNLRAMGGALPEQAMEFYNAAREKRQPILMPKAAWLFGLTATTVAISSAIQQIFTGKPVTSIKDIVAPQINKDDDTERVVVPTYYKDFLHLYHSPLGYVTTSASGPIGKITDIWTNKDFYNYQIHSEHDPWWKQRKDDLLYFIPKPFAFTSAAQMAKKGESPAKIGLSFFGFNKAPGYLTNPEIENKIFDAYNVYNLKVKPKEQKSADDAKKQINQLLKQGDVKEAEELANKAITSGLLTQGQVSYLHKDKKITGSQYMYNQLPKDEKEYLYGEMTPEERKKYDPKHDERKMPGVTPDMLSITRQNDSGDIVTYDLTPDQVQERIDMKAKWIGKHGKQVRRAAVNQAKRHYHKSDAEAAVDAAKAVNKAANTAVNEEFYQKHKKELTPQE